MTFHAFRTQSKALIAATALSLTIAPAVHADQLFTQDFNGSSAWPQLSATASPTPAKASLDLVGTIDVADSTTPSGAALLSVTPKGNGKAWTAGLTSGLLPIKTTETNLGKLTLSFDHSVSSVRPVTVQIESFDANKKRTGGLQTVVYPAAADFYIRAAIDLSTMQAFGKGKFRPTDPYVKITFQIADRAGSASETKTDLRIDNVAYATPTYYVSPNGSDTNDGLTEKTPWADPQKAVTAAEPGDVIVVMGGTYHRTPPNTVEEGIASFVRGGTPAAWVVLKNYPGQQPIFESDSWNAVKIGRGNSKLTVTDPALAYIEVRGIHFIGMAREAKEKFPEEIGQGKPKTNGNGVRITGGYETHIPHHIRVADSIMEYFGGGGVCDASGDWVTVENCTVSNNCWWGIYGGSGISFLTTENFDAADNIYKDLIRNNVVSGNISYEKWKQVGRFSDGNGIIIDSNYVPAKNKIHRGRSLIQNNVTFNNGGSGIHSFRSHRVDIINNTAYYNGAKPELRWGQIFVQMTDDAQMINNILVSRPDQVINAVAQANGDQNSTQIVRSNNIYFGGLTPKLMGHDDLIIDPQFVNPSVDEKSADFHVRVGSPAIKSGWQGALVPLRDLDNKPRPAASAPDRGAYQK